MAKLFGTDGMRGEAGRFPLDPKTISRLGSSLTTHLREQLSRTPVIVTGRDTRESGEWLERAVSAGAKSAGAICQSAGIITTPGIAFLARSLQADAGIVISASHNPYQDNGIKVFAPSGKKLPDEVERMIEADIANPTQFEPPAADVTEPLDDQSAPFQKRYLDYLANQIGSGLSLQKLKLVLDCANGAASQLAPTLFHRLGADVVPINDQPDGCNINLNCGSLHIEGLQEFVIDQSADLGIAFDGDADRSLFVDNKGNFVDGDATLWVLAQYLDRRNKLTPKVVVATVMSNIGLEIALRSRGISMIRTNVGDKYVLEELIRRDASLGGEQSGHLIFPRLSLAGDGMLTALNLLRAIQEERKSLNELIAGFNRFPQVLVNVKVRERLPLDQMPSVQSLVRATETELGQRGRLLFRYSGTELLARVMIEGEDQKEIESQARLIANEIERLIGTAAKS